MHANRPVDGLVVHHLLHHLPGKMRRFIKNYVMFGQMRKNQKSAKKPEAENRAFRCRGRRQMKMQAFSLGSCLAQMGICRLLRQSVQAKCPVDILAGKGYKKHETITEKTQTYIKAIIGYETRSFIFMWLHRIALNVSKSGVNFGVSGV